MSKAQKSKGLRKKTPVFSACIVSNTPPGTREGIKARPWVLW